MQAKSTDLSNRANEAIDTLDGSRLPDVAYRIDNVRDLWDYLHTVEFRENQNVSNLIDDHPLVFGPGIAGFPGEPQPRLSYYPMNRINGEGQLALELDARAGLADIPNLPIVPQGLEEQVQKLNRLYYVEGNEILLKDVNNEGLPGEYVVTIGHVGELTPKGIRINAGTDGAYESKLSYGWFRENLKNGLDLMAVYLQTLRQEAQARKPGVNIPHATVIIDPSYSRSG